MAAANRKSLSLLAVLGITSLALAGCSADPEADDETDKSAVTEAPAPKKAADTLPPTGAPVSAEMRRELRRLAELMPPAEFEELEGKQQQWLTQREQHCAASAELATSRDEAMLIVIECRRDSDAQIMPRLRDRHFKLLAAEPVLRTSPGSIEPNYEAAQSPGLVQAMHVIEHMDQLVIAGGRNIYGVEASSGKKTWGVDAAERTNTRIAVSPNGRILATGSQSDMLVRFWDAETGDFLFDTNVEQRDAPFAFLAGSRHMVIGARRLVVMDLETKRKRPVLMATGSTSAIAVNDDYVVVGKKSAEIVTYAIEQKPDGIELDEVGRATAVEPRKPVVALALSSDGLHLTSVTLSGVIGRWIIPEMSRVSGTLGELRYVGSVAITDRNDVLFLSGNAATRGAKGRVVAIDVEAGLSKRIYDDARTAGPGIALAENSNTLFIGDGTTLTSIRVATSSEGFDNMESLADGALANVKSAQEALDDLRAQGATLPKSALGELSDDTKVHVVGVYEGKLPNGKKRGFRENVQGQVTINVGGSGRAVLVLTAYEPVKWTVIPRGVFVDHILLFGYNDQEVNAPPGTRVYSNLQSSVGATRTFAYKKDANYAKLEKAVREITGKDVDTFQGKYKAGSFSVNSGGSRADPTQSPGVNKWVDEDGVVHYGDQRTGNPQ